MDPDYIAELLNRLRAEMDHEKAEEKRRERRNRRKGARGGGGREVVDADVSEIA